MTNCYKAAVFSTESNDNVTDKHSSSLPLLALRKRKSIWF